MENVDGKIAAILSRTRVVINRGSLNGVEKGDSFLIYTQLGPFYDPDTKADLGTTTEIWGKVSVTTVEDRFCVAETGYETKMPVWNVLVLNQMFGTTSEQIKLPVREDQIQNSLSKIQVGFLAKLVKKDAEKVEKKVSSLPVKSEKLIESSEKVDSPEHIEAKESDKT
jgi:hypothetical protein